MERYLRNAPTYAVFFALIIQVTRVTDFGERIGSGWLAWVYAIFLGATIYVLSYWDGRLKYDVTATPEETAKYAQQKRMERLHTRARSSARLWLTLFLCIDGSLNFAETMAALPTTITIWETAGAMVYGVFPTLAAFGLGSLQALLDKIPQGVSKPSSIGKLADKLLAMLDASLGEVAQVAPQGEQQDSKARKPLRKQVLQDDALLAYWAQDPQASDQQVATHFQVSRQAIQQRRKSLTERGAFMQKVEESVQS